jgi:hypothetical protein
MPPKQSERLVYVRNQLFCFSAHISLLLQKPAYDLGSAHAFLNSFAPERAPVRLASSETKTSAKPCQ